MIAGYGRNGPLLARALSERGTYVLAFETYRSALVELGHLRPELLMVGNHDESADVFSFLSQVRQLHQAPVSLLLMDIADNDMVSRALEYGADDVVLPPHSASAVMLRHHVSQRKQVGTARSLARQITVGRLTLDLRTRQVSDGTRPFSLSGREFELLVRLLEAGGDVVPRAELLEDIWGEDRGSEAVLDATIHRLRKRLGEELSESAVVTTVRGIGYRLDQSFLREGLAVGG